MWNAERYKLYAEQWGENMALYDLVADPGEQQDLAAVHPEILRRMREHYDRWEVGVRDSFEGKEYGRASYERLKQRWPERRSQPKTSNDEK